jgi:hypothetical protein
VYAGLVDPIAVKGTKLAPFMKEGVSELVLGLEEAADRIGSGEVTTAALHAALVDDDEQRARAWGVDKPPPQFAALRKGIASLLPHLRGATPTGQQLGNVLGKYKQQPVRALCVRKWIAMRHAEDGNLWRVEPVPEEAAADPAENFPRE